MSLRPVASLAVKLLGLYAIINALPVLSLVVLAFTRDMFMSPAQTWTAALWNASGGALQMGIGIALWWFSEGVAALMVRGDEKAPDEPVEWQTLAFSTLGLYLCTDSAAHLLRVAGVLLLTNYPPNVLWSSPDNLGLAVREAFPVLLRGLLGMWLLLGVRGIVRGVRNLKNVGRDAQNEV